jgi:hypothetical protein
VSAGAKLAQGRKIGVIVVVMVMSGLLISEMIISAIEAMK